MARELEFGNSSSTSTTLGSKGEAEAAGHGQVWLTWTELVVDSSVSQSIYLSACQTEPC